MPPKIALITCEKLPHLTEDTQDLAQVLMKMGAEVSSAIWNDTAVDWSAFDMAIVRSTWDYHLHPAEFEAWLAQVSTQTQLWNPAELIQWNMRKTYLRDLAKQGVPIVPTVWLEQESVVNLRAELAAQNWDEAILKPAISASAYHTRRVSIETIASDQAYLNEAITQRAYLLQPFVPEIQTSGEWSFIFFNNGEQVQFSHALRKLPQAGDYRVQEEYGGSTMLQIAPDNLLEQARQIVDAIPHDWLYVRVDAVELGGILTLMELELIEPALYLHKNPSVCPLWANFILARQK